MLVQDLIKTLQGFEPSSEVLVEVHNPRRRVTTVGDVIKSITTYCESAERNYTVIRATFGNKRGDTNG